MKKLAATAALAAAMVVGSATSASAFWCEVADKPAGAGAQGFDGFTENKAGRAVFRGAFLQVDEETSFFVRGGDKSFNDDGDNQFGFATEQAQCNGPTDHGVIDPHHVVCD